MKGLQLFSVFPWCFLMLGFTLIVLSSCILIIRRRLGFDIGLLSIGAFLLAFGQLVDAVNLIRYVHGEGSVPMLDSISSRFGDTAVVQVTAVLWLVGGLLATLGLMLRALGFRCGAPNPD